MKSLRISDSLSFPLDSVTQTFADLGIRGSGKTNTGVVMMEEMMKAQQQAVALDPTDAWYGIRSSSDGKGDGFKVIIMGGPHGDLPLQGSNGTIMAEFVVDSGASVVFSLRHLSITDQRRFAQDFAERLYDLKGKPENRTPLHIFIDEADEFVPQRIPHGFERMFGAYDRLVRRGRSSGIGLTLISQRPQVLNKDVLSQCETLICHRLLHKLDRKAIEAWIEAHDTEGQSDTFMAALASLERGTAWIWSPAWLDVFRQVPIRFRETFDSSFTPKAGQKVKTAAKLAAVDLEVLKQRLSATIEKAKQDDPRELRKKIAELEHLLAVASLRQGSLDILAELAHWFPKPVPRSRVAAAAGTSAKRSTFRAYMAILREQGLVRDAAGGELLITDAGMAIAGNHARSVTTTEDVLAKWRPKLKDGSYKILDLLVKHGGDFVSKEQIAGLLAMDPSTSTWRAYCAPIRQAGLIIDGPEGMAANKEALFLI